MSNVDRILEGAVDIHVHFGPDPKVERRAGAIEVAHQAREMGMQGLVLKSHEYPTHPVAYTTAQAVPGITMVGGIALDVEVGGLNPMAVEATANMGGRVVLLDAEGRLLPEVYSILEVIRSHDMTLATGHISTAESMELVRQARDMSIGRIVVTHGTTMS